MKVNFYVSSYFAHYGREFIGDVYEGKYIEERE